MVTCILLYQYIAINYDGNLYYRCNRSYHLLVVYVHYNILSCASCHTLEARGCFKFPCCTLMTFGTKDDFSGRFPEFFRNMSETYKM